MNDLYLSQTLTYGQDRGHGNLLGVQPFMTAADYAIPMSFTAKLYGYLAEAARQGWLNDRTIVVFPEHIGTWLAAAGGDDAVATAGTLAAAMRLLIVRRLWPFIAALVRSREADRAAASLFRSRSALMLAIYEQTFAALARSYGVTIVAGSIVLPHPAVENGRVKLGAGNLYNTAIVFAPSGLAHPQPVRKIYPIASEQPFITAAPLDELRIFDTPAGRLGVLICADAWYPAPYIQLQAQQVEIIAVPSYVAGMGLWQQPWGGYNGGCSPDDVDLKDVGVLSEGEAWRRYALAGRIGLSGAYAGINVFLRGELWDLGGDSGDTLAVCGDTILETRSERAALLNMWL
jgi:predicted amidohydrolase